MGLEHLYMGSLPGDPDRARANAASMNVVADRLAAAVSAATMKLALLSEDDPTRPESLRLAQQLQTDLEKLIVERGRVLATADWLEAAQASRGALDDLPAPWLPGPRPADSPIPWWQWARLSVLLSAAEKGMDAVTADDRPSLEDAAVLAVSAWRRSRGLPAASTPTLSAGVHDPEGMVTAVMSDADGARAVTLWLHPTGVVLATRDQTRELTAGRAAPVLAQWLEVPSAGAGAGPDLLVTRDNVENLLASDSSVRLAAIAELTAELTAPAPEVAHDLASGRWTAWAASAIHPQAELIDGSGILCLATPHGSWLAEPGGVDVVLHPTTADELTQSLAFLAGGPPPIHAAEGRR